MGRGGGQDLLSPGLGVKSSDSATNDGVTKKKVDVIIKEYAVDELNFFEPPGIWGCRSGPRVSVLRCTTKSYAGKKAS